MDSSEENDKVADHTTLLADEVPPFRQIDYIWLFNPFYKFNERKGFTLDDSSLTLEDYS